jgi:hypothetical protein
MMKNGSSKSESMLLATAVALGTVYYVDESWLTSVLLHSMPQPAAKQLRAHYPLHILSIQISPSTSLL